MMNMNLDYPITAAAPGLRGKVISKPIVSYALSEEAWEQHPSYLQRLVESRGGKRVADIGGGANPVLSPGYIARHEVKYTIFDINAAELAKAPDCYDKLVGDVTSDQCGEANSYDIVFSTMLAEHVRSGEPLHRNLFRILAPGGLAFHFFPTLYSPPFVGNYLLPERLTRKLLDILNPRDRFQMVKFPALYSWCRGPSQGQLDRFTSIGYKIEMYRGFFGHTYYNKIPGLRSVSAAFARYLVHHPIPCLTSFAWLLLRKPE